MNALSRKKTAAPHSAPVAVGEGRPGLDLEPVDSDSVPVGGKDDLEAPETGASPTTFTRFHLELLLERFSIQYRRSGNRIDYTLFHRRSGRRVSYALGLLYDTDREEIHVCRFFPGLSRRQRSRYLSAAFFYFMVHHFAQLLGLGPSSRISVKTAPDIYRRFYRRLDDFSFRIAETPSDKTLEARSEFTPRPVDASAVPAREAAGPENGFRRKRT